MSARQRPVKQRRATRINKTPPNAKPPKASARPKSSRQVGAENILDECIAAISLVDVTVHSLELREIACSEQEVLKRALEAIWLVHDWIDDLKFVTSGRRSDREIEP